MAIARIMIMTLLRIFRSSRREGSRLPDFDTNPLSLLPHHMAGLDASIRRNDQDKRQGALKRTRHFDSCPSFRDVADSAFDPVAVELYSPSFQDSATSRYAILAGCLASGEAKKPKRRCDEQDEAHTHNRNRSDLDRAIRNHSECKFPVKSLRSQAGCTAPSPFVDRRMASSS